MNVFDILFIVILTIFSFLSFNGLTKEICITCSTIFGVLIANNEYIYYAQFLNRHLNYTVIAQVLTYIFIIVIAHVIGKALGNLFAYLIGKKRPNIYSKILGVLIAQGKTLSVFSAALFICYRFIPAFKEELEQSIINQNLIEFYKWGNINLFLYK